MKSPLPPFGKGGLGGFHIKFEGYFHTGPARRAPYQSKLQSQGYKGLRAKGNGAGEADAQIEIAEAGLVVAAKGRPAVQHKVEPTAAAEHPL
jgi:hypothetical protein